MEIHYIIRMFHVSKMLYNPDGMLQMKQRNLIGSSQDTAALKIHSNQRFLQQSGWLVSITVKTEKCLEDREGFGRENG